MSATYQAVQWNRQKRLYDVSLIGGMALYLFGFGFITEIFFPYVTEEIMIMRAFGTAAYLMLHLILCIGPLCRLDSRFLPLLYNRRHAGVICFLLALVHAFFVVATYHSAGDVNPLVSIFVSEHFDGSLASIPFQPFGVFALVILFFMAATSHDFWLVNLTAPVWKKLHMCVYIAYALLVLHVTFGVLQGEQNRVYVVFTGIGLVTVLGLHLAAAKKERAVDKPQHSAKAAHTDLKSEAEDYIDACAVADIPEKRARIVFVANERVAVFKYDGKISAVSNVCKHQNGPLGEGRIHDGCITCPWHGWQYLPETGVSPPPFEEKIPTFGVKIANGRVLVSSRPNPAGTLVKPALIESHE
jgi:nitrite reductase/ring-hydroxylating ferredoxin subunit/DMSO/TMAO reductase YedYZ heme-binding membrane subunit